MNKFEANKFERQRQRVLLQAGRFGYALGREHYEPYGWELFTPRRKRVLASGSLDDLENWLAEQWATECSDSGSDRRNR